MGDPPEGECEREKRKAESPCHSGPPKKGRDLWVLLDKVCADVFGNEDIGEETKNALREMRIILDRGRSMETVSTQVGAREIREDEQVHEIINLLDAANNEKELADLLARQWPQGAFRRSTLKNERIAESMRAKPLVLITGYEYIQKNSMKEYGELAEVIKSIDEDALKSEDGTLIERKECIKVEGRQQGLNTKLLVLSVDKEASTTDWVNVCRRMKERLKTLRLKDFALVAPEADTTTVRKAVEVALKKEDEMSGTILGAFKFDRNKDGQRRQIDIELGTRSFSDVVSSLKGMEGQFGGVHVDKVQQRANTIRMAVRAQEEKSKELAKQIATETKLQVSVHEVQNRGMLIRGLDRDTSADEVRETLAQHAGCSADCLKVGDIRVRTNGNFAVVYTAARHVDTLTRLGEIRRGWSTWTIREKIDPDFCVKCQIFGHLTMTCEKEMTKGLKCMKCSDVGHLLRDCKNEPFCGSCKMKGHQMNSMACGHYRYLVQIKRATMSFL